MQHHIFLSYSRYDTSIMSRLRDDFRAAGLSVWTDEGIDPGSPSWKVEIEEAIRGARCLVVIFSPAATSSRWVRAELDYAEAQRKPVFAVLADGDEANAVPFGYSSHQWIDLRNSDEYTANFKRLTRTLANNLGEQAIQQAQDYTPPPMTRAKAAAPAVPGQVSLRRYWWVVMVLAIVLILGVGVWLVSSRNTNNPSPPAAPSEQETLVIEGDVRVIESFTPLAGWRQHTTEYVTISAPARWLQTDTNSDIFHGLASAVFPGYTPSEGFPGLPSTEFHLYLGDLTRLQALYLLREDIGVSLSVDVHAARYREVTENLNYRVVDVRRTQLPAGEAIFFEIDTSQSDNQGFGYFYVISHQREAFGLLFVSSAANVSGFEELTEQIMGTFSFTE